MKSNQKNNVRKSGYIKRTPEQWETIRKNRLQDKINDRELKQLLAFHVALGDFKGEWKEMPENPNYRILSDGRIWSNKRNKFLVPIKQNIGYNFAGRFIFNGKKQLCLVHRLVATTFIPNPDNKPAINHKDHNKRNNVISNLEWVSYAENTAAAIKHGILFGKQNGICLDPEKVKYIRESKITAVKLAVKFGVSKNCIYNVRHFRTWKGVAA